MADVLVVYYSRTGTTETVALALADRLGAELDRIETPASYAGATGVAKGIWHSFRDGAPPIIRRRDPKPFRAIVLCAPVWAGKLAGPARTYLRQAGNIPRLCGVAVSRAGGRQTRFFHEMEDLGGQADIPALSLAQRQIISGEYEHLLDIFVEKLQASQIEAA